MLLSRGKRAFDRQYLWFYILTGGWLLGTLIADVYNGTPLSSRMKGVARVVFFALDFMALAILINRKTRRIIIVSLSIVAVMLIGSRQFRGDLQLEWKFGLSSAVVILALLAASYFYARKRYRVYFGILLVLSALNLAFAFRSQVAVILIATVLTLPIFTQNGTSRGGGHHRKPSPFRLVGLLALAFGAAYLANQAIKFAADRGFFEESMSDKFHAQSKGKLGVLFGGRPETLVALLAIRESPIVGHGSFPYSPKYMQLQQDIQYEYGYAETDTAPEVEYPVIPTHSHLTMAWVESGILGGVLWIYILVLAIRAILRLAVVRPKFAPLYAYLLVNFMWDILYSPFGSVNRLWGAYFILMSYSMLKTPTVEARPAAIQKRFVGHPTRINGRRSFAS
jgi:O-antigen ligase